MVSLVESKTGDNLLDKEVSRRGFLAFLLLLILTGCGNQRTRKERKVENPPPVLDKEKILKEAKKLQEKMRRLVERYDKAEDVPQIDTFRQMVRRTPKNVSLNLPAHIGFINYLRELYEGNKREDLLALIISVLAVGDRTNPRYNAGEACNIYALDFLRLYIVSQSACQGSLTPDCIGDFYNVVPFYGSEEGVAMSLTERDVKNIGWDKIFGGKVVKILNSNNMDWWLDRYGQQLGWEKVRTLPDLAKYLADGHIGLAATSYIKIRNEREKGRSPVGHMMALFNPTRDPHFIARSQATRPVPFDLLVPPNDSLSSAVRNSLGLYRTDKRLEGDYSYWVFLGT